MGMNDASAADRCDPLGNPFAGYGSPVEGTEFVGRDTPIRSVRTRTFESYETASVAIVGPPRVGKSSLARYALDRFATGQSKRGLTFVPVWLTVSGCESEQSLFRELVFLLHTWMTDHDLHTDRLDPLYDALEATTSWDAMRMRTRNYLRQLRRLGYQAVVVLDEFDAARNIFGRAAPFELLRALAYEPEVRVALITTSRRDLEAIVVRSSPELSTFPQIFGVEIALGCFDEGELGLLLDRSPRLDAAVRDVLLPWLIQETGGQPYLASALLSVLHDRWAVGGIPPAAELKADLEDAVATCGALTVKHHEQMLELLRSEGRLSTLLQVVFGPQIDAKPLDAERLQKEGIIRATADGWDAFSEGFREYLAILERTSGDWPLWQQTETRLRAELVTALETVYGEHWQLKLDESQRKIVSQCEARREQRRRTYGELAPDDNILEYTNPADLRDIMMRHWDQLAPFFGQTKADWHERIGVLAEGRTPMAHNRQSGVPPILMERFRKSCQDVLEWLDAAETTRRAHADAPGAG